jgi:glycosyltransferase involved in cell wall biosynthesis
MVTGGDSGADAVIGCTDGYREGRICGWAWRPGSDEPVSIEVLIDGAVVAESAACLERGDLRSKGIGRGWHAFAIPLALDPDGPATVQVRVRVKNGPLLPGGEFELHPAASGWAKQSNGQPIDIVGAAFGLTASGAFAPARGRASQERRRPITFILYCATGVAAQASQLGAPEYSYHFVMRAYRAVLRRFGTVHVVRNPAQDVDRIYDACLARDELCLFLSFAPPHCMVPGLRCPTIPVIAWEYSTIPSDAWNGDSHQDWRYWMGHCGRAITLSTFAAEAIKRAMGTDFPTMSIPAPVWDRFAKLRQGVMTRQAERTATIEIDGFVLDTRSWTFTPGAQYPAPPKVVARPAAQSFKLAAPEPPAPSPTIEAAPPAEEAPTAVPEADERLRDRARQFARKKIGTTLHLGLTWYREVLRDFVPRPFADGMGHVAGALSGELARRRNARLEPQLQLDAAAEQAEIEVSPPPPEPPPPLSPEDLQPLPVPTLAEGTPYPDEPPPAAQPEPPSSTARVDLDGVVFTAVFSPRDGRKNWPDLLTAFVAAFRETPNATLVLKMVGPDPTFWWGIFHDIMSRQPPFACRVVVLHGYLDEARYEALIAATDWALNASLGEGMCLPLVEFMSVARPAVTVGHTAMADYVDGSNAVLIRSEEEYCAWPHDPRNHLLTTRQRVEWPSIRAALVEAYRISTSDPARYQAMSAAAASRIQAYCSDQGVATKLAGFLGLGGDALRQAGFAASEPAASSERAA